MAAPVVTGTSAQRTTSRDAARNSPSGRQHADAPRNVWHRRGRPVHFGRFEFRLSVERKGQYHTLDVGEVVQAVSWEANERGLLTGSVTIHRPDEKRQRLQVGDIVGLEFSPQGQDKWRGLWRMRLRQPEYQLSGQEYVFQLEDDLVRLSLSKDSFSYRKSKQRPRGWRVDEAIGDLCERFDVPIGRLPQMKHRLLKFHQHQQSPLSVLAHLLRAERVETGVRYFLRWVNGKLNVVPFQRSDDMLLMGDYILDGTLVDTQRGSFATVLDLVATHDKGTGKDSDGHKRHHKVKLKTTVRASQSIIDTHGVVRRTVRHNDAESIADLRKWGKRELARRVKIKRDLTFTHPGIPTVRTGDAIRVTVEKAGLDKVICFVGSVAHNVQPGDYSMDVTVQFNDPYVDTKADRVRKQRAAKARTGSQTPKRPKTKMQAQHS